MRVLGIDPSLQSTGFGVVEYAAGAYVPVIYGIITTDSKQPLLHRLNEIRTEIDKIIAGQAPEEIAIENPFFARNVRTALTLGQVRGAILTAVASRDKELFEYSALEIKKAVTGYGGAGKEQVRTMVRALLNLADDTLSFDAADALAAAVCHLNARMVRALIEQP